MSEAGAARQPTRSETTAPSYAGAGQHRPTDSATTRQLPMPPRPSPTPGGSTAAPANQGIDQPVGQGS
jgi:hypothetical protein